MKTLEVANEEKSSEDEGLKEKCLMAHNDDFHNEESDCRSNTFQIDFSQTAKDSKIQDWESSSLYHVKKFLNYFSEEKLHTLNYLRLDLSKSNSEMSFLNLRSRS